MKYSKILFPVLAIAALALTASAAPPVPGQPWTNSLDMKFVPVPGTSVLFSIWETRVQDYQAFVSATRRAWMNNGIGPTHPAANVQWEDAKAFCEWLTQKERQEGKITTQQSYRLPTDAEWSVAVELPPENGSTPKEKNMKIKGVYPWGTQWLPPKGVGNYGQTTRLENGQFVHMENFEFTAPAGSFAANKFGLYDLGGNLWEWCEDWYDSKQKFRVLRGASWLELDPSYLLSSYRNEYVQHGRGYTYGFRVVLVFGGTSPAVPATSIATSSKVTSPASTVRPAESPKPSAATTNSPWTNSLGMKFVPVLGTTAQFCIWETRAQDYQAFVSETGRPWKKPSFEQGPTHPAVMVNWSDTNDFCRWLTKKERREGLLKPPQIYRLPTDAEWSVAVGLTAETGNTPKDKNEKIKGVYPWGNQWPPPRGAGNYGQSLNVDSFETTAPVGSFAANQFGLHDLGGNVWEWCEGSYDNGHYRVLRGGSWDYRGIPDDLLSSHRFVSGDDSRYDFSGFRVVLADEP